LSEEFIHIELEIVRHQRANADTFNQEIGKGDNLDIFFLDVLLFFMVTMPKGCFLVERRKADSVFFPFCLGLPESNFLSPSPERTKTSM